MTNEQIENMLLEGGTLRHNGTNWRLHPVHGGPFCAISNDQIQEMEDKELITVNWPNARLYYRGKL